MNIHVFWICKRDSPRVRLMLLVQNIFLSPGQIFSLYMYLGLFKTRGTLIYFRMPNSRFVLFPACSSTLRDRGLNILQMKRLGIHMIINIITGVPNFCDDIFFVLHSHGIDVYLTDVMCNGMMNKMLHYPYILINCALI